MRVSVTIVLLQVLYCVATPQDVVIPFKAQPDLVSHTISYGDVYLNEDGLVFLYLGPDGTNFPLMWGTIEMSSTSDRVAHPICRQLGFKSGSFVPKSTPALNASIPVWLSNVNCTQSDGHITNHILRCQFNYSSDKLHSNDLHIICESPFRNVLGEHAFSGQVVLFPTSNHTISTSFGMVAIKVSGGMPWKHISVSSSQDLLYDTHVADTLCREMGYTHAVLNSVWRLGEYEKSGYEFEGKVGYSGILSTDVSCVASCPCIRCCADLNGGNKEYQTENILANALVLGCTFYRPSLDKIATEGNKNICEISNDARSQRDDGAICPLASGHVTLTDKDIIYIATIPVGSLILLVIVVIIIFFSINRGRHYYRNGYRRLGGRNGGPHGGGNGSDGNGGNGNGGHGNGGNGNGNGGNGEGGNGNGH